MAIALRNNGSASSARPVSLNRWARLLKFVTVCGCSTPSAFSLIANARSKSGRADEVALDLKQTGEVVAAQSRTGMLRPERFLADRERALEERPRAREVALGFNQICEMAKVARNASSAAEAGTPDSQADRSAANSVSTLARFCASWMRSRLISRIASLSISSPRAASISIVPLMTVAPPGDCPRKMG
jgi:hypothetical protein